MKIQLGQASEYGNFTILATPDKTITDHFIDMETGLLIVEEIVVANAQDTSKSIYATTIDSVKGIVIPIEERSKYIDYSEKEEIDTILDIKRTYKRIVNTITGNEFLEETLVHLTTNEQLSTRQSIAFSKTKLTTIIDSYKESLAWQEQARNFWAVEYPQKTFEEKAYYWANILHQQMRWQGESGLDEYKIYSLEWYNDVKLKEPNFDKLLEYIFDNYFNPYGWDTAEILRRIGK